MSRYARLSRILFSRCIFCTGRLLRERRDKPRFTLRLQFLWLTFQLWFMRFFRSFVNYPGWTIATVTGAIGIILLVIVQIEAFLPKSASETEPLRKPIIETTDVVAVNNKHNVAEVEVLHGDSENGHSSQIETNAQPAFDIYVVQFPLRGVQEEPEQFLVTSVREQHPLNPLPIRTGKSRWKAYGRNNIRTAIQSMESQSPGFRNEPPSTEPFIEPFQINPAHHEIQYPSSDILSSASTTAVTITETTSEQTTTKQTLNTEIPKLKLIVTISDRTQLGQPERIQFQIVNEGQVSAANVILGIEIPAEYAYSKGQSLEYKVGTIPQGETRVARLTPKAVTIGVAVFEIELTADEGFSHILKQQVEVVASDGIIR